MITPGDSSGGGYGGTASPGGLCWLSPQDYAEFSGFAPRIVRMEELLSQLLGYDITTGALSNFSQNGGNILSLTLGQGALADLMLEIGKVNGWGMSLAHTFMDPEGQQVILSPTIYPGAVNEYVGSPILNYPAGQISSGMVYRVGSGFYSGGFYMAGRFMFTDADPVTEAPPAGLRFFMGLHNQNFLQVSFSSFFNRDEIAHDVAFSPASQYIGFQYSSPRGDGTFHIAGRNVSGPFSGIGTPYWYDTGFPIKRFRWYDLSLRGDPGTGQVTWKIVNVSEANATATGSVPAPTFSDSPATPEELAFGNVMLAGFGFWHCAPVAYRDLLMHHVWAQSLDVDTP